MPAIRDPDGTTDFRLPYATVVVDEESDTLVGVEMPLSPKPSTTRVWHYTNAAGALGVIQSNQLWATSITALNDTQEYLYGVRLIAELADKVAASRNVHPQQKFFIKRVVEVVTYSMPYRRFFVSCASEDPDSLSQWRAYGGDVSYAIGLDISDDDPFDILDESAPSSTRKSMVMGMDGTDLGWARVLYDRDEQERLLLDGLSYVSQLAPDPSSKAPQQALLNAVGAMARMVVLCKHPAFRDEKEVRLIATVPQGHRSIRFRPGRFGVTPYVRLVQPKERNVNQMLWRGVRRYGRLPIGGVNIGPTPHAESARDGVQQLLESGGLDAVSVGLTTAPFR